MLTTKSVLRKGKTKRSAVVVVAVAVVAFEGWPDEDTVFGFA